MYEVSIDYSFAAGHSLRNYKGKCENVHGHNYKVRVTVAGPELNSTGLLMDFVELRGAVREIVNRLDHQYLNDLPPFDLVNPSAENIARYFYDSLVAAVTAAGTKLDSVSIWETDTSFATWRPAR